MKGDNTEETRRKVRERRMCGRGREEGRRKETEGGRVLQVKGGRGREGAAGERRQRAGGGCR